MGGYLSFDASVKIHKSGRYTSTKTKKSGAGGIYGYFRHVDRKTDKLNGCEVKHSNENINSDFTLENESYFKNEDGEWTEATRSKEMVQAVNRRIDYAKKHGARIYDSGKNDTTIVRPLLIQLDEESIAGHEDTWVMDTVSVLEDMFGKDNIVGICVHKDETSHHIHVIFTPVYESTDKKGNRKCAVSQTKFFTNPKSLAGMHRKLRTALQQKGYDIELENKPIEENLAGYYDKDGNWHQQGLTPDQLKELTNRTLELKIGEIDMRLRKEQLSNLEQAMQHMQQAAKERQEQLDNERKALDLQMAAFNNDKMSLQAQMQAVIDEKVAVKQMKEDAEAMLTEAYKTADVCTQILSDEKNLNAKFLEFLDKEGQRTNQKVRQYVEHLYKKFQKERKDSLSSWQLEMLRERELRRQNGDFPTPYPDAPNIIDTSVYAGMEF